MTIGLGAAVGGAQQAAGFATMHPAVGVGVAAVLADQLGKHFDKQNAMFEKHLREMHELYSNRLRERPFYQALPFRVPPDTWSELTLLPKIKEKVRAIGIVSVATNGASNPVWIKMGSASQPRSANGLPLPNSFDHVSMSGSMVVKLQTFDAPPSIWIYPLTNQQDVAVYLANHADLIPDF